MITKASLQKKRKKQEQKIEKHKENEKKGENLEGDSDRKSESAVDDSLTKCSYDDDFFQSPRPRPPAPLPAPRPRVKTFPLTKADPNRL